MGLLMPILKIGSETFMKLSICTIQGYSLLPEVLFEVCLKIQKFKKSRKLYEVVCQ